VSESRANWFVALPVEAGPWLDRLTPPPPGVRLFAPSDLHATVAFFGDVGEAAASDAFTLAERWHGGPIEVGLGGLRALGPRRRPSALSATLESGEASVAAGITAVRDDMLDAAGARPDRRPPLPHVTLARIARRASDAERRAALAWASAIDLGGPQIVLDRIALYTWSSDRRQRLFDVVEEQSLTMSD